MDEPPVVWRVELVVDDPIGKLIPLGLGAAVDGDAVLGLLVFGEVEIIEELVRHLKESEGVGRSWKESQRI